MTNPDDKIAGWNSYDPIFVELINLIKPKVIIEVGSWVGASACNMLSLSDARIYCVDTFDGSREHWTSQAVPLLNKKPDLWRQFRENIIAGGYQARVTPLIMTSAEAAGFIHEQADMIYLDGSHEEIDVAADLRAYWPLLKPGGIMFGDDYQEWASVRRAVNDFKKPEIKGGFWLIKKDLIHAS